LEKAMVLVLEKAMVQVLEKEILHLHRPLHQDIGWRVS
jgi:hypothetical protein